VKESERKTTNITKGTSASWDGLPSWLFRKCSLELAPVVTHLVNFSLNLGQIPDMWRSAIVTPIPKVSQSTDCSDYRPISVTPIMSIRFTCDRDRSLLLSYSIQQRLYTVYLSC